MVLPPHEHRPLCAMLGFGTKSLTKGAFFPLGSWWENPSAEPCLIKEEFILISVLPVSPELWGWDL